MERMETTINKESTPTFLKELLYRLLQPWSNAPFIIYFFGFIIGIGGLGIWSGIYTNESHTSIAANISTYFIAGLSTSVVGIVNSKCIQNEKAFSYFFILILIVGLILAFISIDQACIFIAILGSILFLLTWIISIADNSEYKEKTIKTVIEEGEHKHGKNWK